MKGKRHTPDQIIAKLREADAMLGTGAKPGDLWVLGNHRLLCGDSGSAKDLDYLLGGKPIHLVNTEPPATETNNNDIAPDHIAIGACP